MMAKEYHQYPNIIYEIYNEPNDTKIWQQVKLYAENVIKAIRTYDADNIILVGSPHWDQDVNFPAADPIKGYKNIMYTMHFYAATHKQWLRDRTDDAMQKGLPIFISECAAMDASGDGAIDSVEWNKYIQWCDEHKLSWLAWSVSDKNETCSVLKPTASSEGNWKDDDIKEWGKFVLKYLKNENATFK
jgi:endoglucanase